MRLVFKDGGILYGNYISIIDGTVYVDDIYTCSVEEIDYIENDD